jgi:hypothetical protein
MKSDPDKPELSLCNPGEINEFLHIRLAITNLEAFYPVGHRSFDPEGDDVAGRAEIEERRDSLSDKTHGRASTAWKCSSV